MLDKFTERALKAVISSQEEAKQLSHHQIGTEHLLIGLMAQNTGIPVRVLRAVGLSLEEVRNHVAKIIPKSDSSEKDFTVKFSDQAIQALKDATEKAKHLDYIYVGSEHLLMALLDAEKAGAYQILRDLDIDIERLKETVKRITLKRSLNRAHPEIQSSKKLTEITKAIQSKVFEVPFLIEDKDTKDVFNFAREEKNVFKNDTIGTEHLLLALSKLEYPTTKLLLQELGMDHQKIKDFIITLNTREKEYKGINYQLTPVAFRAMEQAQEIATNLGYGTVKPEHILLGIIKEEKGLSKEIFKEFSVNQATLYSKIIEPIEQQKPTMLSIIKSSKKEARQQEYNVVGTEHILLGILSVRIGVACQVLNELGITLQNAREQVIAVVGYGGSNDNDMSFTPRAKKLLELAWTEAKKVNCKTIESEHLLLAIIQLKDSMAMRILTDLGVDAIEIKQGVMSALEKPEEPED